MEQSQEINIKTSPQISELVSALAKAQGKMKPAVFNRVNPHFKTRYADFTSCMDACRLPLSENGLAIIQTPQTIEGKLTLVTMLAHTSGQWMTGEFPLITAKMDSQGIGSAMTYAKRYSLCGMLAIVADEEQDDDGEASVGRNHATQQAPQKQAAPQPPVAPPIAKKILPAQVDHLRKLEGQLDGECKEKINGWLKKQYDVTDYNEIPLDIFGKVLGALQNAVKFMQQQVTPEAQPELAHV